MRGWATLASYYILIGRPEKYKNKIASFLIQTELDERPKHECEKMQNYARFISQDALARLSPYYVKHEELSHSSFYVVFACKVAWRCSYGGGGLDMQV